MIEIKEFNGFIYNKDTVKDISKVVCPPYDVINDQERKFYGKRDRANLIHVLLSQEEKGLDKYKAASKKFQELISDKILAQDKEPAIYFYDHQYTINNERKTRLGFIALLKIDDNAAVFPHENTHLPAKIDRLELLNHVKANLSPIFIMFSDKQRLLKKIFEEKLAKTTPDIDVVDVDGANHKIWKVNDKQINDSIKNNLLDKPMFIADGHHRYEVARQFRQKMRNLKDDFTGQESFNYVMSYFTDVESSDLTILPIHRLVKEKLKVKKLKEVLSKYFDITELSNECELVSLMGKNLNNHVFGLYNGKFLFLKLKNTDLICRNIALDKPAVYKELDVTILKYLILEPLFDDADTAVQYAVRIDEAVSLVDKKEFELAVFVNPIKIEDLLAVASFKEKMPQKSTYFYPKVLSGLVMYKFNEADVLDKVR